MRTITIEELEQRSARLDLSGINFDAFRNDPLDDATLRCLRAMHDVEFHTICYLRDLLVTPAHRDPEVTTFLTFWVYEEYWHGHAIGQVLAAHDERAGASRVGPLRGELGWRERLKPLAMQAASLVGPEIVALQVTWGAINEWTTQAAYGRLAARSGHPVLTDLLRRIMKQEGRHIDFYATQAGDRLRDSLRARRLTRWVLHRYWSPVGSGVLPDADVAFLCDHLFGGDGGADVLARIDRHIDRLPGVEGLGLMATLPTRYAAAA